LADADALLRDGDVTGARAALVDIVRSQPASEEARMFLFQLLAINGEWDKARTQLEALAQINSEARMLAVTYNQAMDGERQRTAVFAGQAEMPLLAGHEGWSEGVARSISLIAAGDIAAGIAARDEAFDNAPDMPGTLNGEPFEWIADADGRFGPTFEIIISGRYGLMPFDNVKGIKSAGPADLRDTIWYPVEIMFHSGQSSAAFLPARYPGSESSGDDAVKLGRMTGWTDREWGPEGAGQRLWSTSDGNDCGLLELRNLEFS
jgi:type VI secretion system protein ImpE